MVEIKTVYQGDKHCELTHGPSATRIETDAPRDNAGRGERFSPTDLMGAALSSCVLTTMAILAEKEGVNMQGAQAHVVKEMTSSPRRIARLPVEVTMPKGVRIDLRGKIEAAARNCPVAKSLHPEIDAPISFHWPD